MKKRFYLEFAKTGTYWNHEHGANIDKDGNYEKGHWLIDISDLDTEVTCSPEDFQMKLKQYIEKHCYLDFKDFVIFEDGRLTGNRIEDNDGNKLSIAEQEKFHKAGNQMYIADYDIYIKVEETIGELFEPTINELTQVLPNMDSY